MPAETAPTAHDRLTPLQVVTLALSVIVLILMLVEATFELDPRQQRALNACDLAICCVFLLDFLVRFRRAPSKLVFMKWGWIDLLSSIPVIDAFRWGRLIRVVRILRLLRAFRSTRTLLVHFLQHERLGSVGSVLTIFGLLVSFAAITVLYVEAGTPTSTIQSPGDAFWWAIVTVTTVGYGDHLPVTPEGRLIAGLLMIAGVGLFGMLSGLVASVLVNPGVQQEETEIVALTKEVQRLRENIERLEASLTPRPAPLTHAADEDAPPA
jgi:voltage-gated potassium channel